MRLAHTAAQPLMASTGIPGALEVIVLGHLFNRQDTAKAHPSEIGPPPPATLTRWLRQGIEMQICPLCRVAHKADREFVWHFSEEGSGNADVMSAMARAHGFCAEHADMLSEHRLRDEVDAGCRNRLRGSVHGPRRPARSTPRRHPRPDATLPGVPNRQKAAGTERPLPARLPGAPAGTIAEGFPTSPGLCFPHFELVWSIGGEPRVRELILDVQRRAVREILAALSEFIRKEGNEAKHEPKGAEQDAWQRAIRLTIGWPAPEQSAGVPETRYMHAN